MKKYIPLTLLVALTLTGCGANNNTQSNPQNPQTTTSATPQTYKDVKNWSADDENNAQYTFSANTQAPAGVEEARKIMQKENQQLTYMAVTVDNTKSNSQTAITQLSFTTPAGDLITYTPLYDYLSTSDVPDEASVDAYNRVVDVSNAFNGDDYTVVAGQKKTLVLASTSAYPTEVTHATLNENYVLTPTDKTAETDKATGAPEPTEPVGSNDKLADLNGTTLKGNDINFRIFSPNAQKEVNAAMPTELQGSWGALCSNGATEEQLQETGASSNGHSWRPLKYAVSESGIQSLNGNASQAEYNAASLAELSHGGTCAVIQSPDASAATTTTTATVGHYIGNFTLESTVEVK